MAPGSPTQPREGLGGPELAVWISLGFTPGIQIAQCSYYSQTLGPNVGIIYIPGSLGFRVHGG